MPAYERKLPPETLARAKHASAELLKLLEARFPDTVPLGDMTLQELGRVQGAQEVIKLIKQIVSTP